MRTENGPLGVAAYPVRQAIERLVPDHVPARSKRCPDELDQVRVAKRVELEWTGLSNSGRLLSANSAYQRS